MTTLATLTHDFVSRITHDAPSDAMSISCVLLFLEVHQNRTDVVCIFQCLIFKTKPALKLVRSVPILGGDNRKLKRMIR